MKKLNLIFLLILAISCSYANANEINIDKAREVLVYLEDNIQLSGEIKKAEAQEEDKRKSYVEGLKDAASTSQKDLLDFLEKEKGLGRLEDFESFFIINAISVKASDDFIKEIKAFPGVKRVDEVDKIQLKTGTQVDPAIIRNGMWNFDAINLNVARDKFNAFGEGVTIGFIDSGVDWTHPAIKNKWRGYDKASGLVDAKYSWLDLINDEDLPTDQFSHGTAVVSIALGEDPDTGFKGVAPEANWIAVRAFVERNTTNINIIKAAQWMLAPGGDPDKAPDIINNSWGGKASDNPWFKDILLAWRSAGITPIFAAGNELNNSAGPGSIENPANLDQAFAVGSVGKNNELSEFSKRGPSAFDKEGKMIKPDVVAPGYDVIAAATGKKYHSYYGTSIATPQVSGLAALLKGMNKDLKVDQIENIITSTAKRLTNNTYKDAPNMGFGYGLIDAQAALTRLKYLDFVKRLSGDSRYQTAVEISKASYPDGADTVYIAGAYAYVDALVMPILSRTENGPLLLTDSKNIPQEVLDEILRLKAKNIVVIGGNVTIEDSVLASIKEKTGLEASRIMGDNRYSTAIEIAKKAIEREMTKEVFLVNGMVEVDAISSGAVSKRDNSPIILTVKDKLDNRVKEFISTNGIEKVKIMGGENTLSRSIEDELKGLGIEVIRFAGKDRFQTSIALNRASYTKAQGAYLANGLVPVDALTAALVVGENNSPITLSRKDELPENLRELIKKLGIENITVLGGFNSIRENLAYELLAE